MLLSVATVSMSWEENPAQESIPRYVFFALKEINYLIIPELAPSPSLSNAAACAWQRWLQTGNDNIFSHKLH